MKLIKNLLFFCLVLAAANCSAQQFLSKKINLSIDNLPITDCLAELQKVNGIGISYSNQIFDADYVKSISAYDQEFGEVLLELLAGTNTNFKVIGSEIVLFKIDPEDKIVVRGYIRDANSGEALITANVYEPSSQSGAITNYYGFYSLSVSPGYHKLNYRYLGTQVNTDYVYLEKDTVIDMTLRTTLTLSEVLVKPKKVHPSYQFENPGRQKISDGKIATTPSLGGEADLLRTAFLLPGVQSGGDGLGGLFVRGGNTDQNLILLDGVPVYNASHLVGIYSIFNSEAIKSSELIRSSIPARYGGRLSSVFDVRTREGNEKKFRVNGGLGLISAKLSLEGPIKKDTSSYFIGYRRSLLDLYVQPVADFFNNRNGVEGQTTYNFQDINAKVNYKINNHNRVYLNFYFGGDTYSDSRQREGVFDSRPILESALDELSWGNTIGSFRWNHIYGGRLFSNTTVTFSRYQLDTKAFIGFKEIGVDTVNVSEFDFNQFRTNIEDIALIQDFDYYVSPKLKFHFGLNFIRHKFDPAITLLNESNLEGYTFDNILSDDPISNITQPVEALDLAAYLETDIKIGKKISGNFGVRATGFSVEDTTYYSLQPRLSLIYKYKPNQNLRIGYTVLDQPLHLLQRSGIGLPTDLWVPSNSFVAPQRSQQISLGWILNPNEDFHFGAEVYYKKMSNLLTYQEGANFGSVDGVNWVNQVTAGQGAAYGIELWYDQNFENSHINLNYTFAFSDRQFDEIANGEAYPFRYDRRHFFKAHYFRSLGKKWTLNSSFVFGTGNAVTLPTSVFDLPSSQTLGGFNTPTILDFTNRNGFRMPEYHRLDLSLIWTESRPNFEQRVEIGVFNIYNRKNPLFITLIQDPNNPDETQPAQFSLLPLLPSISYTFRW